MNKIKFYQGSKSHENLLTVVITLRAVSHYDMLERILYRFVDDQSSKYVNFIVVDDGSAKEYADKIKNICFDNNIDCVRIDSEDTCFSPGRARNVGAAYSKTKYIVHEDVDLYPVKGYYKNLNMFLQESHLQENNDDFFSVPVIYLKEAASLDFFETDEDTKKRKFINLFYRGGDGDFDFYMPASSVILINRNYYLSIGGYNEDFIKWGLEDLEYAYRLTRSAKRFHTPVDFKRLVTNPPFAKQTEYIGWRSQFRLHGAQCIRNELFMFHPHHPVDSKWRNKSAHEGNKKLFFDCIDKFESIGHYLPVISDPWKGRTLMFGKGCFVYNRAMLPQWGDVDVKGYEFFKNKDIVEYLRENLISRVVFTNPYANEVRTAVYNTVRRAGIPFYVVERGALRDSMFVDRTGFCCESSLYEEKLWDKSLSSEQNLLVRDYISEETSSSASLERQPDRVGIKALKDRLGIPRFKKVLFVPLQSRSDTTTKYFSGGIGSYDNFIELIKNTVAVLSDEWVVVVKRHPLSKIDEDIPGVIFSNDVNIKDLIDFADYILLMNSGVGVLATLWFKPVIYTAKAFYASDKLNRHAITAEDVIEILNSEFKPSKEDCYKFIGYLICEFYSFGVMKVHEKNYTENATLTITTDIDYYKLKIRGENIFEKQISNKTMSYDSPFYDIFRGHIASKNTRLKTKNITEPKTNPKIKNITEPKVNPKVKDITEPKINPKVINSSVYKKLIKFKKNPIIFFKDAIAKRSC